MLGGPEDVQLWSFNKQEDVQYGVSELVERIYVSEELKSGSLAHIEALIRRKLFKQPSANLEVFIKTLFKGSVAISVGGDNYCYPWSAKEGAQMDALIRKAGAKTVFWGCSIDEESITPEVREDLERFDLITARESCSYNILKAINPNTVLVTDPAFILEKKELPLPENFAEGNTVGINVSPLIMDYGDGHTILGNYEELIEYILNKTDMNICLIPHVVWANNNDLVPIDLLYQKYSHSGRVCKLSDHNCMELKGFISRCRFFVGARTHATIAAYSSCVPTLVVGYSIKSKGIATDLFGTDQNYVIPVQNLQRNGELTDAFIWMQNHEAEVREKLQAVMPEYVNRAWVAKQHMEGLLEGKH
jgi:polysaccharide pyruvyl transferase WcaK-like protein